MKISIQFTIGIVQYVNNAFVKLLSTFVYKMYHIYRTVGGYSTCSDAVAIKLNVLI